MHANEWTQLPAEIQDASDLPPVRFDGFWPEYKTSPAQAQFTVRTHTADPANGATFSVPMHDLTLLAVRVAYDGVVERFSTAPEQDADDEPLCDKCGGNKVRTRDDDWKFCSECGHIWSELPTPDLEAAI